MSPAQLEDIEDGPHYEGEDIFMVGYPDLISKIVEFPEARVNKATPCCGELWENSHDKRG